MTSRSSLLLLAVTLAACGGGGGSPPPDHLRLYFNNENEVGEPFLSAEEPDPY
jgi:hypothetical protein